jgi:hypothetical protein
MPISIIQTLPIRLSHQRLMDLPIHQELHKRGTAGFSRTAQWFCGTHKTDLTMPTYNPTMRIMGAMVCQPNRQDSNKGIIGAKPTVNKMASALLLVRSLAGRVNFPR